MQSRLIFQKRGLNICSFCAIVTLPGLFVNDGYEAWQVKKLAQLGFIIYDGKEYRRRADSLPDEAVYTVYFGKESEITPADL